MNVRGLGWIAVLAAAACSNITATDEGVTTLILFIPQPAEVEAGQTLQLHGAAVNVDGDTVAVPIIWRALDTTISVDSLEGLLTGVIAGESGWVIARTGTLFSDSVRFEVLPPVDSLVLVAPSLLTVAIGEDSSAELTARLDGGDPPAPVAGRRIVYSVIEPVFASFDARTVELSGAVLVRSTTTTSAGTTLPAIRLLRRSGIPSPDSAIVEVSAYRPGGTAVPGSGQRFVVRFENP
ncbi:MAG TPA: hypothetical protein VGA42_01185 [Gemmatimonadales bacterium]